MTTEWWKNFFNNHYWKLYKNKFSDKENKTIVNFIYEVLDLSKESSVLDLCGGYGRIAVPLAKKGADVWVLDFNNDFLKLANKKASEENVDIQTCKNDMREIPYSNKFDAVINIFSSFGYFQSEEENLKVLKAANKSLKSKGLFLIEVQNRKWIEKNHADQMWEINGTDIVLKKSNLDLENKRNEVEISIIDTKNKKTTKTLHTTRLYTFNELKEKLEKSGFKIIEKYSGFKKEKLDPEKSRKMIILARKIKNL